ncbi:MAG: 2-oxoglutarate dehydrogenase complex dihydrolipoyllysine-residue succinyltransferase [Arsenophonus sp.]|nr:MAG: 2-oxoglutarate dehydrogenase complex dihydrolipoyllysine-residue succinyltransferase [Arsenophonus sp.]
MNFIDILVPDLPESVTDATVATWHKKPGDKIMRDEVLLEIETDKVILEVPAVESGILESIYKDTGTTVLAKELLGRIKIINTEVLKKIEQNSENIVLNNKKNKIEEIEKYLTPSLRRLIKEYNLDIKYIKGSGLNGRIIREDIEQYIKNNKIKPVDLTINKNQNDNNKKITSNIDINRSEKRIPMSRLRKRIAERLLDVSQNTAMLTTFNEVNMKPVINLRNQYGESFEKNHGIRLGFMSFYVKAVIEALNKYPEFNASIDGDDIIYYQYIDISIAVSTPRGLVTPVLRNVDQQNIAEIEKNIKELAIKGRENKLKVNELIGGNFTITNGGIFGSLMSTPIINPPQVAILGMHAIKDRAIVINNKIDILPMMYLALSYDHRLIDGREAVGFLLVIKNILEDPIRLLLNV